MIFVKLSQTIFWLFTLLRVKYCLFWVLNLKLSQTILTDHPTWFWKSVDLHIHDGTAAINTLKSPIDVHLQHHCILIMEDEHINIC